MLPDEDKKIQKKLKIVFFSPYPYVHFCNGVRTG